MIVHRCKAIGCEKVIAPSVVSLKVFLCSQHWAALPVTLKHLLSERAQEGESVEYIATVFVAISLIVDQENTVLPPDKRKPLPTLADDAQQPLLQGVMPYPD